MSAPPGRALPNARVRRFMLAVQELMGRSGLTSILRQAGLEQYVGHLPPDNSQTSLRAAEYAAMMQAIENYYGRGARGTLTRIGHVAFGELVRSRKFRAQMYQLLVRILPLQQRKLTALRWLAQEMSLPNGQVTVHLDDRHIAFVDRESDATVGRTRGAEICWVTLGEIQQALKWATGAEYEVTEMACKAKGDPACRFDIGEVLIG
jgi:predicted hydrocarbon binding protein